MSASIRMKRATADYRQDLEDACSWLEIDRGRALQYQANLKRFHEGVTSEEVLLSHYESRDLVEIFLFWRDHVDRFQDLKNKIRPIFEGGQVLSDDEKPDKGKNRPRNDAFPILLAGRFLSVGIPVLQVEGIGENGSGVNSIADFSFSWESSLTHVECKRLSSWKKFDANIRKAMKQIEKSPRNGVVALDLSKLIRPKGTIATNSSETPIETQCLNWMQRCVVPRIGTEFSPRIFGFILYCRVPAMTPMKSNGNGSEISRSDCSVSISSYPNQCYPVYIDFMRTLHDHLERSSQELIRYYSSQRN